LLDADRRLPPDQPESGPMRPASEVAMRTRFALFLVPCALLGLAARPAAPAQAPAPIVYTVKFPEPARNYALVEAAVPTGGQESVELMMPVWTPGFYRV